MSSHSLSGLGYCRVKALEKARLAAVVVLGGLICVLAFASAPALALNTHAFSSSFAGAGAGAGQVSSPAGVAVDLATHDVYVADTGNARIDEFEANGTFIRAWGWGVADGLPVFETCTLSCQAGIPGSGPGQFTSPTFVAVDNSTGASKGDVYVGDRGDELVTKFSESGALVEPWGVKGQLSGPCEKPGESSPCPGSKLGSFEALGGIGGIVVGATGTLDVLNPNQGFLFEFDQNGRYDAKFGVIRGTEPNGLGVDGAGDLFKVNGDDSVEEITQSEEGDVGQVTSGVSATELAIDPAGENLYAVEAGAVAHYAFNGAGEVIEGASTCAVVPEAGCAPTDSFGSGTLTGGSGVAVDPSSNRVYVADAASDLIDVFTPGVVPDVKLEPASSVTPDAATLNGAVNPDGIPVSSCRFEYKTASETSFVKTASCTPTPGAGTESVPVSAKLSGLTPGSTYDYRLAASNDQGTNYGEATLTTPPAVEALSTGAAEAITSTGARLSGSLSPDGTEAHYYFEYGTSPEYGSTSPAPPGTDAGKGGAECTPPGGVKCSPVAAETTLTGLQPNTTYHYRLVGSNAFGTTRGGDATFTTLGPPSIAATAAEAITKTSATLTAHLDPDGFDTKYRFEYGETAAYGASTAEGELTSELSSEQEVRATLAGLKAGATYHFRLVAINQAGSPQDGPDQTFETVSPALVEGPWATNVAATSATLAARIDPLSSSTTYRLEWGTSTAYGHVFSGSVGEGDGYVAVGGFHIQNLEPNVTYHYRLIAINEAGTITGADHALTTQPAGEELTLPDGRAWELVSPTKKGGALIQPLTGYHTIEAAGEGAAIAYEASDAIGENPVGKSQVTEVLSVRAPSGWSTRNISMPRSLPPEGTAAEGAEQGVFNLFSSNLSLGVAEQTQSSVRPLSAEATERTPYLRNDLTCEAQPRACYTPLVTPADVEPPSQPYGGENGATEMIVVGATNDLSHLVLQSPYALTSEAVSGLGKKGASQPNLYEWSGGHLQLVNVLPDGTSKPGAHLGYEAVGRPYVVAHTISNDGRWIVWSFGAEGPASKELFVRDMVAKRTVPVGGSHANFQTMSSDGSRIFFRENGELYELNSGTGAQTDLTASHKSGEASAGVQDAILGSSEDGSYVYFVAKGVLATGAASGADNLYVLHDGADGWSTTHIATLSGEDEHSWFWNGPGQGACNCEGVEHNKVSARVSPNGRYVTFMSDRSLTGYDNTDAVSGQPDEEVYLYDAAANRLVCASCNPTGARPVGALDGHEGLLVDPERAWAAIAEEGSSAGEHWLAGIIPTWQGALAGPTQSISFYQPRFLSNQGRLFFDSPDSLAPQATDGLMNVYEYEPTGLGSCTMGSWTFHEATAGCVSLISSGTSGSESSFYDASESGDDVFFITASRLVPADVDTAYDVYDAHVCTTEAPCSAAPVSSPPCTSGDSCKAAPSPQPPIFAAPPSETFNGAGNVVPEATKGTSNRKTRRVQCKKGYVKKHGRCVKKHKRLKKRARKASNDQGAR